MVKTAVTDVISPAVTAKDPVRALDKELAVRGNFLKQRFSGFFSGKKFLQLIRTLTCFFCLVNLFYPFLHGSFKFSADGKPQGLLHHLGQTLTRLFYPKEHAETVFRVILEQRVCPAGSMALAVLGVRHCRRTGSPD